MWSRRYSSGVRYDEPKVAQERSIEQQYEILYIRFQDYITSWKMGEQHWRALSKLIPRSYHDPRPEIIPILREFLNWIEKLNPKDKPSMSTWDRKISTLSDSLMNMRSTVQGHEGRQKLSDIQAWVRSNPTLKTTPKSLTLDRWSQGILDEYSKQIIDYLKKEAMSGQYEGRKRLTLYSFGIFLSSINCPKVFIYNNGTKGDITSDTRHPFWTALWERLRDSGYSLKLIPSREGICIVLERIPQDKIELPKVSQTSPVKSKPENTFQPEVLWENRAQDIIREYKLVSVVQRLHENGVDSINFWDLLRDIQEMNVRTLISPPENRKIFIEQLDNLCRANIWMFCRGHWNIQFWNS